MKNKRIKISVLGVVISLLMPIMVKGEEVSTTPAQSLPIENIVDEQSYVMNLLQSRLNRSKKFYETINEKIFKTKDRITVLGDEVNSLSGQLDLLKGQIAMTEKKILEITKQVLSSENNIRKLMEQMEIKEVELKQQKNEIRNYLELIYYHKNNYYNNNEANPLKIILSKNYISDIFKEDVYLKSLEEYGRIVFDRLKITKLEMELKSKNLETERARFIELNAKLSEEKKNLIVQKEGKEKLLEQTQGQKEVFEEMLNQTLDQQKEAEEEIKALQQNIQYFNQKINHAKLSPDEYKEVMKIKEDFTNKPLIENIQELKFPIWPVIPKEGLSAYFQDGRYKKVFRVEHNAVDIPVIQGTAVLAPKNGIVLKVADNGYGYSYIIVAHRNNLLTVYGHISQILVTNGEFVKTGQIIGLSGGAIGSLGAGARTTGPHLHFEVHYNGTKMDPLDLLDLTALPIEAIPASRMQEYVTQLALQEAKNNAQTINPLESIQPDNTKEEKIEEEVNQLKNDIQQIKDVQVDLPDADPVL